MRWADQGKSAAVVAVSVALVWGAAIVQHRVFGVAPRATTMVVPTALGVTIGIVLAVVLWMRRRLVKAQAELAELNRELEARVAAQTRELAAAQRMETVGRVAGGLAHDINNLLTVLSGTSHELRQATHGGALEPTAVEAVFEEHQEAIDRIAGLTSQMLALNRAERSQLERLDLVANLVVNARDAMPDGGTVRIELRCAGDGVTLAVSDTGVGIPDEQLPRIFEPLFTTKPVGKGTGLGLAVVHEVVSRTGGRVQVSSRVGQGTVFSVIVPRA